MVKITTEDLIKEVERENNIKLIDCQKRLCDIICNGEYDNVNCPRAVGKSMIISSYCNILKRRMNLALNRNSPEKENDIFLEELREVIDVDYFRNKLVNDSYGKIDFNDFNNKEEQLKCYEEIYNEGQKN